MSRTKIIANSFTLGLAPLSWVIASEMYPNHVRGKAMGVVCFFLYASSFGIAQVFPVLSAWFTGTFGSPAGMYLIFSAICWSGMLFSWKMIPETKGLKLEEMETIWQNH